MTIYSPSGAVVYEAPITKSAIIRRELMGDYYIELVFDAVDRIDIGRGCYILYNNHRFEIMNNVIPDDTNQGGLRYTLRFESQQSQMKRCNVFWREGGNLEVSFALTSDISTFGQLIIDNVNAFLGGSTFSLGSVPSGAEMKTISFAGDSCWDAVATIAETFGVEWWTEEDGDNVRLCFGKLEVGESVEFRKGDIVSSIPSKKGDDANYGTRFYVFGSTKNLPEDYGSTVEGGITNNVVEKRLHLPNGMQYIDAWPNLTPEDIVEKTVFFEDVMPTNVETITEVYSGNAQVIPGTSHKVYDVVCANSPFTLDDVIEGETIQANFTSGSLNGQTFDLELTQTSGAFNKTFRIVPKILDKDSLTILPQGEMIPRAGDTFILLNVNLPKGRIDEAEQRLLEVGQEYVKKNSSDTEIYDCPTNAVYCHKNDCNYVLGQRVTLVGDMFGDGRQSRIQGYEKKLYDEYQATYTVGDNSSYSRLASLEKSIRQANYSDRVGLEANIIRSKNDATIPSDFNVYSALASEEIFLSKRRGGTVKGHTDFEKGISMYGIPIVYDEETKTWVFEGNLVATRGISAFGSLSTPVASLFEALPIDGTTIKRDPITKELYVDTTVVGGGGSGGGSVDPSQLEAYLKPYAKTADVASTYATIASLSAVTSRLNDFLSGSDTDTIINKWSELETFLAGLTETDNLATILSGKANKATTLAGYGITDAYTKSHIDSNFVTIGTKQQITGEKDFVGGFKVNGGLVEYNATLKAWVLNGDLLVTGGVSAFSNISGFKPSTITEAVLIDNKTIKLNADGLLYAVAQETDGINEGQLADYLTTNGYATQSWVTGRGYITGITGAMVTNALGYTPYNSANFTKANIKSTLGISDWALASAKPTYAYSEISGTPTSLKNPNALSWSGYSSGSYDGSTAQSIALPTKLSQLTDDVVSGKYLSLAGGAISQSGYWSTKFKSTGQTSSGIAFEVANGNVGYLMYGDGSKWQVTAQNWSATHTLLHSGNYSEYALPITGGVANGSIFIGGYDNTSNYYLATTRYGHFARINNLNDGCYISFGERPSQGTFTTEKTLKIGDKGIQYSDDGGSSYKEVLHSGNYSDYALPLTGGTVNGQVTSEGVENFVAKGSAYSLYFGIGAGQVNRGIYDLTLNKWWIVRGADATTTINASIIAEGLRINQTAFDNGLILNRTAANSGVGIVAMSNGVRLGTFGINGTKTFEISGDNGIVAQVSTVTGEATFNGMTTIKHGGNTPLVINQTYATNNSRGVVLMNGSMANGHMYYSHLFGKAASSKNSAYVGFYNAGAGSDNNYLSMGLYGVNNVLNITAAGNVGIGTSSPSQKLHVAGNLLATGGITARNSSDRRLKKNIRKFNASKVLMSLGGVYEYEYVESEVQKNHIYEGTHYGLIYQHVKGTKLDVMCHEREDGFGTLNYIHPKFISLVAGATMENISEVEKLKREIRHLKTKVKQLESRA